jgi:hypothetical protein
MKLSFVFVIFAMTMASASAQTCATPPPPVPTQAFTSPDFKCENLGYDFGRKIECQYEPVVTSFNSFEHVDPSSPKCPASVVVGDVTIQCSGYQPGDTTPYRAIITSTVDVVVLAHGSGGVGGYVFNLVAGRTDPFISIGPSTTKTVSHLEFCFMCCTTPPPVVTPSPSKAPTTMDGDPHIKNWAGDWFEYMGEW